MSTVFNLNFFKSCWISGKLLWLDLIVSLTNFVHIDLVIAKTKFQSQSTTIVYFPFKVLMFILSVVFIMVHLPLPHFKVLHRRSMQSLDFHELLTSPRRQDRKFTLSLGLQVALC